VSRKRRKGLQKFIDVIKFDERERERERENFQYRMGDKKTDSVCMRSQQYCLNRM
jgi:hypothetical protein